MRPETLAETLRELAARRDEKQAAEQAFVAVLSRVPDDMRILAVQDAYLRGYDDRQSEIDALQAELAAARQEFAEWLDASRKALDTHAEVVTDRDRLAACVERVRECGRVRVVEATDDGDIEEWADDHGDYFRAADILAALGDA
jgi:fructose-1,6-bisphosphatase/sedoheptulose 1,7-bisphosphatase-like protein